MNFGGKKEFEFKILKLQAAKSYASLQQTSENLQILLAVDECSVAGKWIRIPGMYYNEVEQVSA